MKWRTLLLALATAATATLLSAQVEIKQTAIENSDNPRIVTITGEVVRVEPGQTIVLRSSGKETIYTLSPSVTLPPDVQIGKTVTLSTEPPSTGSGPAMVTKVVTTTTMTPEGQTKTTTEKTEVSPSGDMTKTTTTTISGTVSAFEPGQFITIESPDHQTVRYTITKESQLPQDVAVGKTVEIRTYTSNGTQFARQVTITKTKTKTRVQ